MKIINYIAMFVTPVLLFAAPENPASLTFSDVTETSVTLHWVDNSDDESGFKIYRGKKLIEIVSENQQIYVDRGLLSAKAYTYTIKATDDNLGTPVTRDELNNLIDNYDGSSTEGNKKAIENANVSEITNMNEMFSYSEFDGDLSRWDTSKVTDMSVMFLHSRFDGDLSSWDTSKVTNMYGMFAFSDVTIFPDNFDTSNVTNMRYMFYNSKIRALPEDFDTSKVTGMSGMFYYSSIRALPADFDTSNVKDMHEMFRDSWIASLPDSFNTSKVTDMVRMFSHSPITTLPESFVTSNVEEMNQMFQYSDITTLPDSFDTSSVTNMRRMFSGAENFNQDISHWSVDAVNDWTGFNENASLTNDHIPAKFR